MNNSDITEQYLNKVYEDLSREQMSLMNSMKSQTNNENTNTILIENESAYLETLEKKLDDINVQQQELMKKLKQHYMDKIKKIQ
jgi:predicted transcriptional regulator